MRTRSAIPGIRSSRGGEGGRKGGKRGGMKQAGMHWRCMSCVSDLYRKKGGREGGREGGRMSAARALP
jgi:hypothetical protein